MAITCGPNKNERHIRERGLSFERAEDFDFDTGLSKTDHADSARRWSVEDHQEGYRTLNLSQVDRSELSHWLPDR
jgi:uncharacterized DUF497 family protein